MHAYSWRWGTKERQEGLTVGDLRDLADGDASRGRLDLGLSVGEGAHDGGRDDLGADDLAVISLGGSAATWQDDNFDGRALGGPVAVVEVEEVARLALVEDSRAAESQRAVATRGEARGEDGAGLGRLVKLELEVASDVTSSGLGVRQNTVGEAGDQGTSAGAGGSLLWRSSAQRPSQADIVAGLERRSHRTGGLVGDVWTGNRQATSQFLGFARHWDIARSVGGKGRDANRKLQVLQPGACEGRVYGVGCCCVRLSHDRQVTVVTQRCGQVVIRDTTADGWGWQRKYYEGCQDGQFKKEGIVCVAVLFGSNLRRWARYASERRPWQR